MRKYENCYNQTGEYDVKHLGEALLDRVYNTSQISKPEAKIKQNDIEYVLGVINRVNALNEFELKFEGYDLEDVYIPKCLSFLVWPQKVSIVSSYRAADLLPQYPTVCDDPEGLYSMSKMVGIIEKLYATQKTEGEKISVKELRVNKILNDIDWFAFHHEELVTPIKDDPIRWLIPVKDILVSVYGEDYFMAEVNYILDQYIIRWAVKQRDRG